MINIEIVIVSDHSGFEMKSCIMGESTQSYLRKQISSNDINDLTFTDLGTDNAESVDYPNYAKKLTNYMVGKENIFGILICGSGIGMCMTANRASHIRAVLATDTDTVFLSRVYNNANALCIGARMIALPQAIRLIETFIITRPSNDGRHVRRVEQMGNI